MTLLPRKLVLKGPVFRFHWRKDILTGRIEVHRFTQTNIEPEIRLGKVVLFWDLFGWFPATCDVLC